MPPEVSAKNWAISCYLHTLLRWCKILIGMNSAIMVMVSLEGIAEFGGGLTRFLIKPIHTVNENVNENVPSQINLRKYLGYFWSNFSLYRCDFWVKVLIPTAMYGRDHSRATKNSPRMDVHSRWFLEPRELIEDTMTSASLANIGIQYDRFSSRWRGTVWNGLRS